MHCMGSASGISSLQGIIGNPVSLEESVKTDAQFLSLLSSNGPVGRSLVADSFSLTTCVLEEHV